MPKIYDCFTFFNELDLLTLLSGVVTTQYRPKNVMSVSGNT